MGYRSEVAIALDDDATQLVEELAKYESQLRELLQYADERYDQNGHSKFYWSSVKWYDGYEDVDMMMNVLHNLPYDSWLFIRVGEETEDLQQEGGFWESDMYITRGISL